MSKGLRMVMPGILRSTISARIFSAASSGVSHMPGRIMEIVSVFCDLWPEYLKSERAIPGIVLSVDLYGMGLPSGVKFVGKQQYLILSPFLILRALTLRYPSHESGPELVRNELRPWPTPVPICTEVSPNFSDLLTIFMPNALPLVLVSLLFRRESQWPVTSGPDVLTCLRRCSGSALGALFCCASPSCSRGRRGKRVWANHKATLNLTAFPATCKTKLAHFLLATG